MAQRAYYMQIVANEDIGQTVLLLERFQEGKNLRLNGFIQR